MTAYDGLAFWSCTRVLYSTLYYTVATLCWVIITSLALIRGADCAAQEVPNSPCRMTGQNYFPLSFSVTHTIRRAKHSEADVGGGRRRQFPFPLAVPFKLKVTHKPALRYPRQPPQVPFFVSFAAVCCPVDDPFTSTSSVKELLLPSSIDASQKEGKCPKRA